MSLLAGMKRPTSSRRAPSIVSLFAPARCANVAGCLKGMLKLRDVLTYVVAVGLSYDECEQPLDSGANIFQV